MPDISMCSTADCPSRRDCYRFMAKPNDYWQSYMGFTPDERGRCDYFWPLEKNGTHEQGERTHDD